MLFYRSSGPSLALPRSHPWTLVTIKQHPSPSPVQRIHCLRSSTLKTRIQFLRNFLLVWGSAVVIRSFRWAIPGRFAHGCTVCRFCRSKNPPHAQFLGATQSRTTTPDLPPDQWRYPSSYTLCSEWISSKGFGGLISAKIFNVRAHGIDLAKR